MEGLRRTKGYRHSLGKGKVIWGQSMEQVLSGLKLPQDFAYTAARDSEVLYLHRRTEDADIYFVANQKDRFEQVECTFRVSGKLPEIWDAATGQTRPAATFKQEKGCTNVPLELEPSGSFFIIFRKPTNITQSSGRNFHEFKLAQEISKPWTVKFDPKWGGPESIVFDSLADWAKRPEEGIKYYSGTAEYVKEIEIPAELLGQGKALYLDLGKVKNLAEVIVNDKSLGVLWKPPFRVEITNTAHIGLNKLGIRVTNLWPNRLIGDEQFEDDCEWNTGGQNGSALKQWPIWLVENKQRPSKRYTFTTWKYYNKNSPLLESGLLGPVTLQTAEKILVSLP